MEETLIGFLMLWLMTTGLLGFCALVIMGIIAFTEPDEFDSITRRRKVAWVIGILFVPFVLVFIVVIGVLAAFGFRYQKVTLFSEWLRE